MQPINYADMDIPQLRAEAVRRGITIGTARTKDELINLLRNPPVEQLRTPPRVQPGRVAPTAPQPVRAATRIPTVVVPPLTTVAQTRPPVIPTVIPPTVRPTGPTGPPTVRPTGPPVVPPTVRPTGPPVVPPTVRPTVPPVVPPTVRPTVPPVVPPTVRPTAPPVVPPTVRPTVPPVVPPTVSPTVPPTVRPPGQFANQPVTTVKPQTNIPPVNQLEQSIRQKLQGKTFDSYDSQWRGGTYYGGNNPPPAALIGDVLRNDQNIQVGDYRGSLLGYLMTKVTPQFVADIVTELGFRQLNGSIDVFYNLLWYINVATSPYRTNLTADEKAYISGLTIDQLVALLGPQYRGPRDKAALIFAIISGRSAANPGSDTVPRYQEVITYPPASIWLLASKLYNIMDEEDELVGVYPPYLHVALQAPSPIEQLIGAVNVNNVDTLLTQYQIVVSPLNNLRTPQDKVNYFIDHIGAYRPVFARPANIPAPPVLAGKNKKQIKSTLEPYTIKEIVDAYEPMGNWNTRKELINLIHEEGQDVGSKWSWRHRHCNNDDTMNIMDVEPHGQMNKDDPNDPTLSYGVRGNYRCYQAAELIGSWREDPEDHIFHFRVPDWTKTAIDKTNNQPLIQDFPIESIRQLRELLRTIPAGYNVRELVTKVNDGLAAAANATVLMRRLMNEYNAKSEQEKGIIRLYLVWLFVYGMWMRFWKGPGYEWPVGWVEGGGGGDRCETGRRDEHIFIQNAVKTAIVLEYEKYPGLKQWIESLPLVDYNFRSGEAKIATGGATNIVTILNKIQLGDFCMAHGSDLILKTSYYLIARILGLTNEGQFNQFIESLLPTLVNIEQQVVSFQLYTIQQQNEEAMKKATREGKQFQYHHDVRERVNALEARQTELAKPVPRQPPFRPTKIGETGHTDPGLGRRIEFNE